MKVYLFVSIPDDPILELVAWEDRDIKTLTAIKEKVDGCHNLSSPISQFGVKSGKVVSLQFHLNNFLNCRRFGNPGILEELETAIVAKCEKLKDQRRKK